MYGIIKQKYGDSVAAKVEQLPKQPMLRYNLETGLSEPVYQKSYDAKGTMHNV